MTSTQATVEQVGTFIGRAMARDVLDNSDLSREWTGLEPQDVAQIPEGMDIVAVEAVAERVYRVAIGD